LNLSGTDIFVIDPSNEQVGVYDSEADARENIELFKKQDAM